MSSTYIKKYHSKHIFNHSEHRVLLIFRKKYLLLILPYLIKNLKPQLMSIQVSLNTKNRPINSQQHPFLENLEETIHKGIQNRLLSVRWLASEFHISERQLLRIIKNRYKVTTNEYINNHKLDIAKQVMILNNQVSIKVLANKLLFNDTKYFSKLFKYKFGINPSEMKESNNIDRTINLGLHSQAS